MGIRFMVIAITKDLLRVVGHIAAVWLLFDHAVVVA